VAVGGQSQTERVAQRSTRVDQPRAPNGERGVSTTHNGAAPIITAEMGGEICQRADG
jgi:hypothetical protein